MSTHSGHFSSNESESSSPDRLRKNNEKREILHESIADLDTTRTRWEAKITENESSPQYSPIKHSPTRRLDQERLKMFSQDQAPPEPRKDYQSTPKALPRQQQYQPPNVPHLSQNVGRIQRMRSASAHSEEADLLLFYLHGHKKIVDELELRWGERADSRLQQHLRTGFVPRVELR